MAHGDTEVTQDDVTDVTIIPTTKEVDADSKRGLNPEQGKSSRSQMLYMLWILVSKCGYSDIGVKVWLL
jgi:hypothetical protein